MWKCPKCKGVQLAVVVTASALLFQTEGNFETEVEDDHDWDETSSMHCRSCSHTAAASGFLVQRTVKFTYTMTGVVDISDWDPYWATAALTSNLRQIGNAAVQNGMITCDTNMTLSSWEGAVDTEAASEGTLQ
jgi:hypothetical protein